MAIFDEAVKIFDYAAKLPDELHFKSVLKDLKVIPEDALDAVKLCTDIDDYPTEWNEGLFAHFTREQEAIPRSRDAISRSGDSTSHFKSKRPQQATVKDTRLSLNATWKELTERWEMYMKVRGYSPTWFETRTAAEKDSSYEWATYLEVEVDQKDGTKALQKIPYPPFLRTIPTDQQVKETVIFDVFRLFDTAAILEAPIPEVLMLYPKPWADALTIKDIETRTHEDRDRLLPFTREVYGEPNIGDRSDWFTDKVWAQQMFTGPNPMIIKSATGTKWIKEFTEEAISQNLEEAISLINDKSGKTSLYVADYSYFRDAASPVDGSNKIAPDATLCSQPTQDQNYFRYACAGVGLFNLTEEGRLHPLAICLDYKGSMSKSVTIFNKYLEPGQSTQKDEENDWPWRYAKTCLGLSDWVHHELRVHLVDTHLVEEVIIVAAHNAFDDTDPIIGLLEPHWFRTLSLNAAARKTLVPGVITSISGFQSDWVYNYIINVYKDFNFQELYVPKDLKNRGFPPEALSNSSPADFKRFHNYAYARNINLLWEKLRDFVSSYLESFPQYNSDDSIKNNSRISTWCQQMRDPKGGNMPSFPEKITNKQDLVDVLTMCIHIASPQHTAVNYLQQYYYTFVINKPPALYSPLPPSLETLKGYTEQDLMSALPTQHDRDWLLASHLPWLLSYPVASDQTLTNYAKTLIQKTNNDNVKKAGEQFLTDLKQLATIFAQHCRDVDIPNVDYMVMDPDHTAVSILI